MAQKLTHEIIIAAIAGFEAQKISIDSRIAELRSMLGHRMWEMEATEFPFPRNALGTPGMALCPQEDLSVTKSWRFRFVALGAMMAASVVIAKSFSAGAFPQIVPIAAGSVPDADLKAKVKGPTDVLTAELVFESFDKYSLNSSRDGSDIRRWNQGSPSELTGSTKT